MTGKMRHPREEPAFLKVQRKLECEKHSLSRRAYLRKVIHQLRRAIVNNFFERVKLLEWKVYKGMDWRPFMVAIVIGDAIEKSVWGVQVCLNINTYRGGSDYFLPFRLARRLYGIIDAAYNVYC